MVHQQLEKIFEAEAREDWYSVFLLYKELYTRSGSREVTIHFAFFCWYLLWQWDEIVFPGEDLTAQQRIAQDVRCGLSRPELMHCLDKTTRRLLTAADETPTRYLVILIHMQRIYPYFFDKETFSDEIRERLYRYLALRQKEDPGTEFLYAYQENPTLQCRTQEQKDAIRALFSENSLMHRYFCWLFRCWKLHTPMGKICVDVDGEERYYTFRKVPTERSCRHLRGRYVVEEALPPDGKAHTVSCRIRFDEPFDRSEEEGRADLKLISFWKDGLKLSMGIAGDSCAENGQPCSRADYTARTLPDGMVYELRPDTRTTRFRFGIAWLNPQEPEQEKESRFGADPTLFASI